MTEEQIALARRAVACKGWRWMRGMYSAWDTTEALPDLTDPATLGCLLALVREAWGDECACVLPIDYGPAGVRWVARLTAGGRCLTERHWLTETEALVAALEAAP